MNKARRKRNHTSSAGRAALALVLGCTAGSLTLAQDISWVIGAARQEIKQATEAARNLKEEIRPQISGNDVVTDKFRVQRLAEGAGLHERPRLNPGLRFLSGDIAYWSEQKLTEDELIANFVARRKIIQLADQRGVVIRDQGELSWAAQKLVPDLLRELSSPRSR